jgi:hypothetical protein
VRVEGVAGCEVELRGVRQSWGTGVGTSFRWIERTNLAFLRQATTSDGRVDEIVGFVEVAEA